MSYARVRCGPKAQAKKSVVLEVVQAGAVVARLGRFQSSPEESRYEEVGLKRK